MRVLLAAKFVPTGPRPIGGVQTWVATVRDELIRLGHGVCEWQPGMDAPKGRFDLGILANMCHTWKVAGFCDRVTCVSHGIIPDEEPGPDVDRQFYVSEGVRDFWKRRGDIIRQPIDLAFWRPTGAQRGGAVRYTYRKSATLCADASAAIKMGFAHVSDATPEAARVKLATAALVFASGRAALEAMACGAPTVIYDHRSAYQGPLMDDDLVRQMRNSYSGRGGFDPTLNQLVSACHGAKEARGWVEEHHDARAVVRELIA